MRQIIYLEPQDNIATIREKMEHAQASEVLLVVPPRFPELRSLINLKLIKRYAQHLAVDLALVVRDAPTRTLAKEVGLVLTSSVDKGRRIEIKPRKGQKDAEQRPSDSQGGEQPARTASVRYTPKGQPSAVARLATLLFVTIGLGLLVAGFLYLVLPAATITLVPAFEDLHAEMEISAIPGLENIDYGLGQIPASIVSVELGGSANTPATGKRDIPDAHAEGTAVFANKTTSAAVVSKGTIVRTGSGTPIRFYTVTDLELPAERGAHGRVQIIAVDAGPRGNVKRLTINDVEGDAIYQVDVINDEPTTGGGLKRVSEVTAEDMGRVKNALLQRLNQEALTKLQAQLAETEFIPAETVSVEVIEEEYDKSPGDIADVLNLRLKVVASGTLVGGGEANTLILGMLESRMPEGYALVPETLQFRQPTLRQLTPDGARFSMSASGTAVSSIPDADIRRAIAGMTVPEAMDYLQANWDYARAPEVLVTPEWIGRIPWIPYRITVKVETEPSP